MKPPCRSCRKPRQISLRTRGVAAPITPERSPVSNQVSDYRVETDIPQALIIATMYPVLIIAGVILGFIGVYALRNPFNIRGYTSPQRWKEDPETAEQRQQIFAFIAGIAFFLVGLGMVVAGIVFG
jgi:cytochrome b561